MKDVVVDASLAIKWVLREEDSHRAIALLCDGLPWIRAISSSTERA